MNLARKRSQPSNIAEHFQHKLGDLEQGFAAAEVIVEREFFTSTVHQGYIEPQNGTALWNTDGQVTIWCSTQGAFGVRDQVSEILQIPVSQIRVIPMEIGGGFGGKNPRLPGTAGGAAFKESRQPPGENDHEPRGSARGDRPDLGFAYPGQDGRGQARENHRRAGLPGL